MSDKSELDRIRTCIEELRVLRGSSHVMVALAAERAGVVLIELLLEVAPEDADGPWQELPT